MADSPSRSPNTPLPGAGDLSGSHGAWKLTLWSGAAWFSAWFYRRLQWPAAVKRTRLDDLKPNLPAGGWEELLLAIRNHLERQLPLDLEVRVELSGQIEWWRIQGSAERNAAGQPMHLVGTMHDVSARHRDPRSETP